VEVKKAGKPIEVLLIEDDAGDLLLTKRMLAKTDYNAFHLICAESLSTAIKCSTEGKIDVILSDLNLPDSSGIETFLKLKLQVPEIPIVVFSGFGDEAEFLKAVREGAQDYLIKGQVDGNSLVRSLRYAIERKMAEDNIRRLAYHDSLTGLPSRTLFADRRTLAPGRVDLTDIATAGVAGELFRVPDSSAGAGLPAWRRWYRAIVCAAPGPGCKALGSSGPQRRYSDGSEKRLVNIQDASNHSVPEPAMSGRGGRIHSAAWRRTGN